MEALFLINANCGHELEWNSCYGTNKKYWCKDSFSHPAKAAPDLCNRIIDHLEELGILKEGGIVIDPLAGIGTSLLTAAVRGYKTIGVELEPKFVDLINKNISFVKEKEYLDYTPIIIQGDARKLSELLVERNLISITSPPYGNATKNLDDIDTWDIEKGNRIKEMQNLSVSMPRPYSFNPDNIGNMKDNIAITSPPYGLGKGTGHNEGDIERMIKKGIKVNPDSNSQTTKELYYGTSPDQIGNLKDDNIVVLTSPPYLNMASGKEGGGIDWSKRKRKFHSSDLHGLPKDYGAAEGQIGNIPDVNTYQGAMLKVYQEMYKCCSAAAIITKNPTKKMRIYPLDKITISLLELAGWKIKCIHHAILCWEEIEDNKKVLKGRVGFFKRLQWSKGSPIAMWEDIITVVK